MANRLQFETSPYLLAHQHNPVDWYPWGPEALELARAQDRPILLSIGYSACHWCHVMERESFEDPGIAALMNEHFVCIKVDREERPDLDSLYMAAVQGLTGQGGWPMTVFLLPDGRPFFAGTYFPPSDRYGHPGFPGVLRQVAAAYRERLPVVEGNAQQVTEHLRRTLSASGIQQELGPALLDRAAETLRAHHDPRHGGFGGAPKFPPAMSLEFLLRHWARGGNAADREVLTHTLDRMAHGGIYDQIGGGFHRYSVDAAWQIPHFEKMLYDNALLARLYALAYQAFGREEDRRIVCETLDWVRREMTSDQGGFYSSLDADSEGHEGKFYVWTPGEIEAHLGPDDGRRFGAIYGITMAGNFEGASIPHIAQPLAEVAEQLGLTFEALAVNLKAQRELLYAQRSRRVWPGRDEKILTAWNGMMLRAFADAGRILERPDYLEVARANARFLLACAMPDDRLMRSYRDGDVRVMGFLEDHANLADGMLALYEATWEPEWLEVAKKLGDRMVSEFWDDEAQGFFDTGRAHETLVARPAERFDNATPAASSVACDVFLRLGHYLGEPSLREKAMRVIEGLAALLGEFPNGFGRLLCAADFAQRRPIEVGILGAREDPGTRALIAVATAGYRPHQLVAVGDGRPGPVAFLRDRPSGTGRPTAYVCVGGTCGLPITEPAELERELRRIDGE